MNTTNLITDYIISGILGLLTILVPWCMIDNRTLSVIFTAELKNETILAVGITIVGYAFGVVFNQIADKVEDYFYKIFKMNFVNKAQDDVLTKSGLNHHYALQLIVAKSEPAYDYISFRRTMIRIIRAILCLSILIPIFHLIFSLIYKLLGYTMSFNWANLILLVFSLFLIILSYRMLRKIYNGYYAAITNFALILKKEK